MTWKSSSISEQEKRERGGSFGFGLLDENFKRQNELKSDEALFLYGPIGSMLSCSSSLWSS